MGIEVYDPEQIETLVRLYLDGAGRENLDPILDACVVVYKERFDEDGQVDFKGRLKHLLHLRLSFVNSTLTTERYGSNLLANHNTRKMLMTSSASG